MDFFERMERLDTGVNRFYARRKVWIWGVIALPVVYLFGWMVWVMFWAPPVGGVTLIIHSKIDRPILVFSVNGVAGVAAADVQRGNEGGRSLP